MPALSQILEAEFEVMKLVWKYAPINTNEITERLTKTTPWGTKTAQTLIKRLMNKRALTYEEQGRVSVHMPLVGEDEYLNQGSRSFLRRYYDGSLTAMVSPLLEHDTLSEDDIAVPCSFLSQGVGERG